MEEKPRRGFTDPRARRLNAHAIVVGCVAALLMLLLASYWVTAPELGPHGWTLASIVAGLAVISAACVVAAYRVQLVVEREAETAAAVAAGWDAGPVEPDQEPPAPAPAWSAPVPPVPLSPAVRRPVAPAPAPVRVEPVPAPPTPAEVTEPAHH